MIKSRLTRTSLRPASHILRPRPAFTLVELLVVITIIGILASLITVAAVGALRKGQEARIKVELNQIADAIEHSKTTTGSYPPNAQTDDTDSTSANEPANAPLSESQVLADLKRYLQQVAPRHRESDGLLRCLVGLPTTGSRHLPGGLTAGEAIVFWLGGFSSDPKYPISGEGGPSYLASQGNNDPISARKWAFPFEISRLAPRDNQGYFDSSAGGGRYIEYPDPRDSTVRRRINFWQYIPAKSKEPFLYFDTSRHPAGVVSGSNLLGTFDPPAATVTSGVETHVHAFKRKADTIQTSVPQVEFVNPEKFQVLHCGIDDAWGVDAFEKMSIHDVQVNDFTAYLLYPDGPFTGDIADTITNFSTTTRLEDVTP